MDETIWYKSKTFWFGVLVIVIGILEAIMNDLNNGISLTAIGIISIILRILTKSEILFPQKVENVLTAVKLK